MQPWNQEHSHQEQHADCKRSNTVKVAWQMEHRAAPPAVEPMEQPRHAERRKRHCTRHFAAYPQTGIEAGHCRRRNHAALYAQSPQEIPCQNPFRSVAGLFVEQITRRLFHIHRQSGQAVRQQVDKQKLYRREWQRQPKKGRKQHHQDPCQIAGKQE